MNNIQFKQVFSYDNNRVYHAITANETFIFSVEIIRDKKGILYRCESSLTGFFEEYGFKKAKAKITAAINEVFK